jgi:hypothetical protein
MERTCSIQGCDRPIKSKGLCYRHWYRARHSGDPGAEIRRWEPRDPVCSVEGCDKPTRARQLCGSHWSQWNRTGAVTPGPTAPPVRGGCSVEGCSSPHQGRGYCNSHLKKFTRYGDPLVKARGKASEYRCISCGDIAEEWAYDHSVPDPDVKYDVEKSLPYSLEIFRYIPMCVPCHRYFDAKRKQRDTVST